MECNCNEGGICNPCYDAECDEVQRLKLELEKFADERDKYKAALERIEKIASERCGNTWDDLQDYAKEALK